MAVTHKVWRLLAISFLTVILGFVAACGDDDGAIPTPGGGDETGSISGTVSDATGAAVAGAQVGTTPATNVAFTDAQGRFQIQNVPEGSFAVTATREGFNSSSVTVDLDEGEDATGVNITLTQQTGGGPDSTGTVTGLVSRSSGQAVAEGTEVLIFRDASACGDTTLTPNFTATTDAGGRYLVNDIPAGAYVACVTASIGGQEFVGRAGFVVNGGEITEANITVGRDADQTTEPNIGGTPVDLDDQGNFEGAITFIDVDGDGDSDEDCNVIRTQHLWVVEVTDGAGTPVSGVRVEWSLNQAGGGVQVTGPDGEIFVRGTTGVIVDTDDPFLDPVQAESAKRASSNVTPQFKVDDTHAVTYTNDSDQTVDFNGETVTVATGQTWIIVTSPIEGFTDVIAFSPDLGRGVTENGDKAFAVKRWVNWRLEVAELTGNLSGGATAGGGAITDTLGIIGSVVADGDTITNRLDRTPDCPAGGLVGDDCDLSNRAFLGLVISRLRTDSPFTFISGAVNFAVTDDVPDTDIDNIDSSEDVGGPLFTGGGVISADENSGDVAFVMDGPVSFECEAVDVEGDCLDIDVVNGATNALGQDLSDFGFTITPGAEGTVSAIAVTVSLDSLVFFAEISDTTATGFTFSDDLQRLIEGTADLESGFTFTVTDEFGEVCADIDITKRWVSSVLRIFKQGPSVVALNDQFEYTVTVVNDGEDQSNDVVIADTLPLEDVAAVGDRQGGQAFRYVTDDPTFDPDGIRYYIDTADDGPGVTTDVCFEAPDPVPTAFVTPALCPTVTAFATIDEARTAAEEASAGGDQVVIVEYFDENVLARTQPGGDVEAEDSFEITLEAFQSINAFRIGGALPVAGDPNFAFCNIATVTSAENDFAADSVCTTPLEALLEVRKTVDDAIVPAGDQVEFLIEIGNNGSDDLTNVTVSDTFDVGLEFVMIESLCEGCTADSTAVDTTGAARSIITFTVPVVPPTDDNANGIFDDGEGFVVANLVLRTPLAQGQFCNRVTVSAVFGDNDLTDTDLACVLTQVEIEFDIVNDDGLIVGGAFTDVETFQVGDTVAYQTIITNRSNVAASNVSVLWEIAPEFGILDFLATSLEDPTDISCSTASDTCSVTVATLAPSASISLNYTTLAVLQGNDVNRITLNANELSLPVVNEEPTTVNP
ncbi:MAG: carboxypeptidase regulatory-like domain-containing protein [Gemmatimonadetes bacterium]|nr:carboxypeptidase regulatory-like domain-containing protein [Gemmatimonadota bacterium]